MGSFVSGSACGTLDDDVAGGARSGVAACHKKPKLPSVHYINFPTTTDQERDRFHLAYACGKMLHLAEQNAVKQTGS